MFFGRWPPRLWVWLWMGCILCVAAQPQCPRCGSSTVPFPLSTNPSCGQSEYRVVCNQSKGALELPASSGLYPIRSIDPANRRLVISSTSFRNSSCLSADAGPKGGLLLDTSLAFNITSSNTVFLLNCSSALLLSPLNCSQSSLCHRYVDQTPEARFCRNNSLCCTFTAGGSSTSYRIRALTDGTACSAYVSVVNLNPDLQPGSWSYGVELGWPTPREAVCSPSQGRAACPTNSACRGDTSTSYRCLCNDGYAWNPLLGVCSSTATGGGKDWRPLILGLAVPAAAGLMVLVVLIVLRKKKLSKAAAAAETAQLMKDLMSGKSANIFSAKELRKATRNFSREFLLGSGGFGDVYRGTLEDGTVVAIKAARLGSIKGRNQVINEVSILSQVNHRNLVRLWGCCVDTNEPLLVYEYVPNGTLSDWLQGRMVGFLSWRNRLRIAQQTAEGLAYLHSAAVPPIYHRDVKSSNILLDELLNARVCDFGLSRLAEPDISHVSTCAQGTLGYLDPEYYRKYQLTDKSDVYSFGVVLLEIVTSQKAIDFTRDPDDVNLAIYVTSRAEKDALEDVVDRRLLEDDTVRLESILAVTVLALNCLQESRNARPTMREVAEQLGFITNTVVPGSGQL